MDWTQEMERNLRVARGGGRWLLRVRSDGHSWLDPIAKLDRDAVRQAAKSLPGGRVELWAGGYAIMVEHGPKEE